MKTAELIIHINDYDRHWRCCHLGAGTRRTITLDIYLIDRLNTSDLSEYEPSILISDSVLKFLLG